jgi:hypothetical protein
MPTIENLIQTELDKASSQTGIPKEELHKLITKEFGKGKLPRFMKLANITFAHQLIEEITEEAQGVFSTLDPQLVDRAKDTFRLIIYNLVAFTFTRSRISLSGSHSAYNRNSPYRRLYFTRNSVQSALSALDKYIVRVPGNTYRHEVDSYEPNQLFQLKLMPLLYSVYSEYDEDTELVIIQDKNNKQFTNVTYSKRDLIVNNNNHTMRRTPSIELERTYLEDLEQLVKVNDALKDASYALKAPVQRIYSRGHVMFGGRLYTPLANLPDRKARIRINTLFNGNPVAEVDLKANHASMLYALKAKQLPRDFYDLIAQESRQTKDKVKWLVMKMIGAKNRVISLASEIDQQDYYESRFVLSQDERVFIETTIQRMFPDLHESFYKDLGVVMQSLEGDILLDAMCELVDQGIVSLPVHDALYVERQYAEEAEKALKASWKKNLNVDFEPFIDVDRP